MEVQLTRSPSPTGEPNLLAPSGTGQENAEHKILSTLDVELVSQALMSLYRSETSPSQLHGLLLT